jgi:dihydroorotase
MKSIEALCVTSQFMERKKITFNEQSGLIESLETPNGEADQIYNNDCLLFAGMGDVHIHAREDVSQKNCYKEDFLSAQMAMHHGGVTHAGDMPNNPIPPIDDQSYKAKVQLAEKSDGEIWMYAGIGPKTNPLSFKVPYKVYMGPSIGELFFEDLTSLDKALSRYENQWVSFHCEDPEVLEENKKLSDHHLRRPIKAESMATRDALALIKKYHLMGKLCHFSSRDGLNLVREARTSGLKVMLEVTPQHLFYDLDSIPGEKRNYFQMNPPIRNSEDRIEMLKAFNNGEIDFLATDHAPHTRAEKNQGTSGLTGLDTFGPFVTWLIKEGVDPKIIAKTTAENPGEFFNQFLSSWKTISSSFQKMGKGLGFLETGYRANFSILNLKKSILIKAEELKTKVAHSPFEGITFPGSVEALYLGGKKQ